MLGLLSLVEGRLEAVPEGVAAARLPLALAHDLGLPLADLTHQRREHVVDVVAERRRRLEERTLELSGQLTALLY